MDAATSQNVIRMSKRSSSNDINGPFDPFEVPSSSTANASPASYYIDGADEDAVEDSAIETCISYRRKVIENMKWDDMFSQLVLFESEHKHCDVPTTFPENQKLANWVRNQRRNYQKKKNGEPSPMTEDRVRQLEELGFRWEVTASAWDVMFSQLVLFESEHEHCDVPTTFPENQKLANWVMAQRSAYKKKMAGKHSTMTDDRIRRLEEIGFRWSVTSVRDLPQGVEELPSGNFRCFMWLGGKQRHIGTFDTPEQASAARMSVKKDVDGAKLSALSANELDAIFDTAKAKSLEASGEKALATKSS